MVFGHLPSTIEQEADFVRVYDNLGRDLDIQQQNLSFLIIDTTLEMSLAWNIIEE